MFDFVNKAKKAFKEKEDKDADPYGTDDLPDPDASGSSGPWKRVKVGASRAEKKQARWQKSADELGALVAAANQKANSVGSRGAVVDHARRLLDDRPEITPAWNDHGRIFNMKDGKTSRLHHGCIDLPALLDKVWPSRPVVGRFGLPEDFGDVLTQGGPTRGKPKNPLSMIYNERFCELPANVATRNEAHFTGISCAMLLNT